MSEEIISIIDHQQPKYRIITKKNNGSIYIYFVQEYKPFWFFNWWSDIESYYSIKAAEAKIDELFNPDKTDKEIIAAWNQNGNTVFDPNDILLKENVYPDSTLISVKDDAAKELISKAASYRLLQTNYKYVKGNFYFQKRDGKGQWQHIKSFSIMSSYAISSIESAILHKGNNIIKTWDKNGKLL